MAAVVLSRNARDILGLAVAQPLEVSAVEQIRQVVATERGRTGHKAKTGRK